MNGLSISLSYYYTELLDFEDLISIFKFSVKIMSVPIKIFNEWRKHALLQLKKKFNYEKPNQTLCLDVRM